MNERRRERLYNLLPSVYRQRDVEQEEPLRALLGVIEETMQALEGDIDELYNNWFIETCDEWSVPYIGDLLSVRGLHPFSTGTSSLRAYVANTIRYRRRKGTVAALELLSRDVTGWPARAVEFFQLLSATQNINHIRLARSQITSLKDAGQLQLLGGPFESAAHTADVRRIDSARGRYNIPNIGIFLWRLQSYDISRRSARLEGDKSEGRYAFSPLGNNAPLFNRPQTEADIVHLADEINVPGRLRRQPLYHELEARRKAMADGITPHSAYFGDQPVLQIFVSYDAERCSREFQKISPEEIFVCNLADWASPPQSRDYLLSDGSRSVSMPIEVALDPVLVDPVLGRLAFVKAPEAVEVSYIYGFSGDIGGGPYQRRQSLKEPGKYGWSCTVSRKGLDELDDVSSGSGRIFCSIAEALHAWINEGAKEDALITIADSRTYEESISIHMPKARTLVIQAGNGKCPVLCLRDAEGNLGEFVVSGDSSSEEEITSLILNGLVIEGGIRIQGRGLRQLNIVHCTLVPGWQLQENGSRVRPEAASISAEAPSPNLEISIDHSIVGALMLPGEMGQLSAQDSIIDGTDSEQEKELTPSGIPHRIAIASDVAENWGPSVSLERTTAIGEIHVKEMALVSESILIGVVSVQRQQSGCVRFSYVPDGSVTPKRYRCQPDMALAQRLEDLQKIKPLKSLPDDERELILARVRPSFTSQRYGDPAYAQLGTTCSQEICTGAEDGSEMGAFGFLKQPQRQANLLASLDEYLRFGLVAGIFYCT
jgi:hypothetical protein